MKRLFYILSIIAVTLSPCTAIKSNAVNPQKGNYFLYCHMSRISKAATQYSQAMSLHASRVEHAMHTYVAATTASATSW